jgi:hypothetical protein
VDRRRGPCLTWSPSLRSGPRHRFSRRFPRTPGILAHGPPASPRQR